MLNNNPLVAIHCATYNHGPYIRQCLDGFSMQKTEFPFLAVVVDDASTDEEQEILRDYISSELDSATLQTEETDEYIMVIATHKNNPNCTFVIYFLKYNHYSINKSRRPYFIVWDNVVKYIAPCEGDDYWIDPLKLQKQVGFLEENPDFTMVCNRTKLYSEKRKKFIGENYCYNRSQVVNPKDVIYRTGLFISTCSRVYKKDILEDIPDYWAKCKVGDYPLQIMCTMKGNVYYFNEPMSVYRVENSNSWMGQQKWGKLDKGRLEVIESQINMFKGFTKDFPQYKKYFDRKIANHINRFIPAKRPQEEIDQYMEFFREDIENYSLFQKFDLWMCKLRMPKVRYLYKLLFQRQYSERKKIYQQ